MGEGEGGEEKGSYFDCMLSNHAVWGWKAPVKTSVSGVSLLQLSPFFASIFPLSTQKRLILRLDPSLQGSKGWRGGESTRLPPMWSGFKSRRRRPGLSLMLVLSLALRGFYPGSPVFTSPQKQTFPNSNSL